MAEYADPGLPTTTDVDCYHMYCVTRKQCDPSGRGWNTTTTLLWTNQPKDLNTWFDEGTGWYAYWKDLGFTTSSIPTQAHYNQQTPELTNPSGSCSLSTGKCVVKKSVRCGSQELVPAGWTCVSGSHTCCKTEVLVDSASTSAGLTLNCWINEGGGVWYKLLAIDPQPDCATAAANVGGCVTAALYGIPGMDCDNWHSSGNGAGYYVKTIQKWQQTGQHSWGWLVDDFDCGYYTTDPETTGVWVDDGCPFAHKWEFRGSSDCTLASPDTSSHPTWTCPNV